MRDKQRTHRRVLPEVLSEKRVKGEAWACMDNGVTLRDV